MKPKLQLGTVISFEGIHATVIADRDDCFFVTSIDGGEPDFIERWEWELDGEACSIISMPQDKKSEALQVAEDVFRRYAHHHSLNGDTVNAEKNMALAHKMADALAE